VAYAVRHGNRVRLTDAIVHKVTARKVGGRLRPMLLLKPTGEESGFTRRKSARAVWVAAEHVRLINPGVADLK
jgi:hypothetical protein